MAKVNSHVLQSILLPKSGCADHIIRLEEQFNLPALEQLNASPVGHALRIKAQSANASGKIDFGESDANGLLHNPLAWLSEHFTSPPQLEADRTARIFSFD